MNTLIQNRSLTRVVLLVLIVILIILVSWRFAAVPDPTFSFSNLNLASDVSSRASASTDAQVRDLQNRLKADPDAWAAYSQLGLVYLQKVRETGDPTYYQKSEEALDKALSMQPDDYVAVSGKGALALARHDFVSALDWGERARQINPDRPYAYGVMADAQVELGWYSEAVETLQTMVNLRPDMSSYARISYMRELHGDTPGAIDLMQRAVDSGTPSAESTAWVRAQLGNLYFNIGDLDQAELEYRRTLQNRPDYVYALAGLGRVLAAKGDGKEAAKLLNQAVKIMPMPEFVITLGDLYQVMGQPEKAGQQYQLLATIETLHRANGVDMDMEIALFNADHDRNLEETVVLARTAYSNRPSIHAADVVAWALYKTGQYEEAQEYSNEALQLGTKDALKLFHAGMIAHALGQDQAANQYLNQALTINPYFSLLFVETAKQTLQSIQKPE